MNDNHSDSDTFGFCLFVIAVFVTLIFLAWVSIGVPVAKARDAGQWARSDPATRAWFSAQHNARGQWCCDRADGHDYFDGYEMLSDGGVKLADGTVLPAYMVLNNANPTGKAVYWYAGDGPERVSYCFSPGPQG